jgi:hypothetical protein
MSYFLINPGAQIIGFIALTMALTSFQQNTHRRILFFQSAGSLIFSIHFFMLGAYTGMILNIISLIRNIVFYNKSKKWATSILWLYFFTALFVLAIFYTYEGIISVFPLLGCIIFTASFWITNPALIRRISWLSSPMWIIYNVFKNSWAGVITEVFALLSIVIAMLRFDVKSKPGNTPALK